MKHLKNICFLLSVSAFSAMIAILGDMYPNLPIHVFYVGILGLILAVLVVEGHREIAIIILAAKILGYLVAFWNTIYLFLYWNSIYVFGGWIILLIVGLMLWFVRREVVG